MSAQLRTLRKRLKSTQSIRKITKAQELVATSRIAKAQERVAASMPYARAMTSVMTSLASNASINHPLLQPRATVRRAGVLVITADKGMCGGYNANVIRTAEQLISRLAEEGKVPVLYVAGRRGVDYYQFRGRTIEQSWTGFSQKPAVADAREITRTLLAAFMSGADDDDEHGGADGILGVDELHLVHTRFVSLLTQTPEPRQMAPLEVEEVEEHELGDDVLLPDYEFEPNPEALLDSLLPKYLTTRIYAALIDAAASESAARRRAMKAATDNADEMIKTLRRSANAARQAAITQEISEIVGGASALSAAGRE
ncbi:F0F1 ATP synthase subunit gamma [Glycomyces sp. TRM65418]|uniref:F0F1 ATP synthase subunit gamma n=1 Tax=Glycomyces sp. TRM65418 TaxID=2867006 RepID=UPI001CE4F067|nr:F0F1 ATP synthase subunit gamma [Glycomyces sp. TRM65418]MCC3764974.1 F0F1 ATP synthase subunit gamma [Glycomyces sp. TRM65418]QZD54610.1 F0F1 ATP synthase subunit gamma [Glycomyces sp. TRM65418]